MASIPTAAQGPPAFPTPGNSRSCTSRWTCLPGAADSGGTLAGISFPVKGVEEEVVGKFQSSSRTISSIDQT